VVHGDSPSRTVSFSALPVALGADLLAGVVFLAAVDAAAVVDSLDFTATFFSGVCCLADVLPAGDVALVADLVAAVLVVVPVVVAVLFAAVLVAVFFAAMRVAVLFADALAVVLVVLALFAGALAEVFAADLVVLATRLVVALVAVFAAVLFVAARAAGLVTGLSGVDSLAAAEDRAGAAFFEAAVAMLTTPCTCRGQIRAGRRQ
jgi:hypothetical protein